MSEGDRLLNSKPKGAMQLFKESLMQLREIPNDLWLCYTAIFTNQFMMFGLVLILPILLSDEFGYSDTAAGSIFGALGGVLSLYAVSLGTFLDKIGVKIAMILAS